MTRDRQASTCLKVCVVLEDASPSAWWHTLLERIDTHPYMTLGCILILTESGTPPSTQTEHARRQPKLLERLADGVVHSIVDRHQHDYRPLQRIPLAPHMLALTTQCSTSAAPLSPLHAARFEDGQFDVIIQSHGLSSEALSVGSTRLWMPDLLSLRERAIAALTARAPFFCMRVLEKRAPDTTARSPRTDQQAPVMHTEWRARSRHTLPLQIFSITDLEIIAHACLPGLFMAELNWLRLGVETDPNSAFPVSDTSDRLETVSDSLSPALRRTSIAALFGALNLLWHQLKSRLLDRFFYEQWQLAIVDNVDITDSIDGLTHTCMSRFRSLTPPDRYSWADPHLANHEGIQYAFFEAIEIGGHRGRIDYARLDQHSLNTAPRKRHDAIPQRREKHDLVTGQALASSYHLSYPFILETDKQHWMIPETSSDNIVSLYRSTEFPERWERVSDLLTGVNVADCTLVRHDDRWWLFGNTMTHVTVDERDELRIWYADSLTGPWQAHPMNPVLTGVHHARMAGGFLFSGGELYRPSQFGGWRYGHAINLARVDCLTTDAYRETLVGQIRPPAGSPWLGCHSITHSHGVTLIDRVRRRSRLSWRLHAART